MTPYALIKESELVAVARSEQAAQREKRIEDGDVNVQEFPSFSEIAQQYDAEWVAD